jgi:hypothetical protein
VITAPRDAAEPVEAVDGSGDQQRGRESPAAGDVHGPGRDDTDLHEHHGDARQQRLDPVLPDRGVDAAVVDAAQVGVHGRCRRRELDRADRLER